MTNNHIVIMAGGVGSRLYPLSTTEHPKQFLDLLGSGQTLIQSTYERFREVDPSARFWVVTSERYIPFIHEQLPDIPDEQILPEPAARNTAPCIAWACWKILKRFSGANIIVTPSDAFVSSIDFFAVTMRRALSFTADKNAIVCIGIKPDKPHTGYGYIQVSEPELMGEAAVPVRVAAFKEKPDLETAKGYLARGGYYWNAGIFVWNAATIEAEIRRHAPQIAGVMDALSPSFYTPQEQAAVERLFPTCENISIDYAVMEKSTEVYTLAADWPWSDLGSFEAIEALTGRRIPR
ncbi:MAG: mannose-1-phosphate guanylyltransferase [Bacteroidales bacterium]|nr:mannose-1-phosphate guanylyltransferase [Bacteroidales bacterium]